MRTPAPIPAGFVVANTAMLWLTTAIATVAFWPIYQAVELVILVVVVLMVGSAIAIVGASYRLSGLVVLLASIVAYFLLGVPLAVPDRALNGVLPTAQGVLDLLAGTALGWKQLITITLPVGSFQSLLVPTFVLVLLSTVIGLSIALRARFGELAVLAPVVLLITAILFGPERASWPIPLAIGMLVASLFWLIWARWYRRRRSIRMLATGAAGASDADAPSRDAPDSRLGFRTIIGAAITMAIAAGCSVTATTLFPVTAEREVLRTSIEQPFDPRDYVSPLSGFRAYHQQERTNATMFTVVGLPENALIRLATLDSYDGVVYSVGSDQLSSASGSFVRVPTSFDQSSVVGQKIKLDVTIEQYDGVWMPTIGKLENVAFSGVGAVALRESFFYNDNSGTAAVVKTLGRGDSYTLTAVIPTTPSASQLAALQPGGVEVPRAGPIPDELAVTLSRYIVDADSSGERLQAMIAGLKAEGYISHGVTEDEPASRSGHAADRLTQLLTDQRMLGDEEQYAVTAALMAAELGFPARVVFGFVPDDVNPNGVTVVRGDDVSAWIEVNTSRYGWVPIDPTPELRDIPAEEPEDPTQVARPQSPVQPPVTEPELPGEQLQPDSAREEPELQDALLGVLLAVAQALGLALSALLVLLSPFIAIAAAKLRRRFLRKRAPTPIQRICGGWQEFEDSVVDHGYNPPQAPTRFEVARTVGGVRSLVLASVADRAVFSPDDTAAAEADQVWKSVEELHWSLGDGLSRWQRIRALVSVRSLGGYSGKSLFRR